MSDSLDKFVGRFNSGVESGWDVRYARYYRVDNYGKSLTVIDGNDRESKQATTVSIDDTENPIVFSLVSGSGYRMSLNQLSKNNAFYCSNVKYEQRRESSICCHPIRCVDGKSMCGVYVIIASDEKVDHMLQSDNLEPWLKLFCSVVERYEQFAALNVDNKRRLTEQKVQFRESEIRSNIQRIANSFLGETEVISKLQRKIAQVAMTENAVMLRGETGVGKEVVAQAIHTHSKRAKGSLVAVNCSAIPDGLLESELFGYVKGAFTGADGSKDGLFAKADKGSILLDEIGDMPLELQGKILRVIQEKCYRPIGAVDDVKADFRVISATHRPLEERVEDGGFRQDLFYRLNTSTIMIPPIRERVDDIPLLVEHFIEEYIRENGKEIAGCSDKAMEAIKKHHFPGNVRELKNVVVNAASSADVGGEIVLDDLDLNSNVGSGNFGNDRDQIVYKDTSFLESACKEFESDYIREALDSCGGSRKLAAEQLGIPKRTLAYKCKKLGICS